MEHKNIDLVKEQFTHFLDEKKLRKTTERFAILEEIYTTDGHFDAESLYVTLKQKGHTVSRATVYNSLELLLECDLITRHQFGSNMAQYEKSFGYHQHDHLICTECKQIFEFCDPRISNIQKMVEEVYGFQIDSHFLNFYGKCNDANCEGRKTAQAG